MTADLSADVTERDKAGPVRGHTPLVSWYCTQPQDHGHCARQDPPQRKISRLSDKGCTDAFGDSDEW